MFSAHLRHTTSPRRAVAIAAALALGLSGCSTPDRLEKMEKKVDALLDDTQRSLFPASEPEDFSPRPYSPYRQERGEATAAQKLNLRDALQLAANHSREYQTARETLYTSALTLKSVSHDWDWNPVNSFTGMFTSEQDPSSSSLRTSSSLGVTRRFASGARLSATIGLQTLRYFSGDRSVNLTSLGNLTLTQPLLAGAGAEIAREPLTQAERNLIYALRSFVRARSSLLISIAEKYYAVLNAKDSLEIGKRTYASVKSSLERSEAMAEAGRVDPFQVDQARQKVFSAESNLVSLEEAYQSAVDTLKTALGLPLDTRIEADPGDLQKLAASRLPRPEQDIDAALQGALDKRLDHATVKNRLDDAERAVRIAADAVRARLDLSLVAQPRSNSNGSLDLDLLKLSHNSYGAGVTADLPFDRTNQLLELKRRHILLTQQRRRVDESRDNIIAGLRQVWRQLRAYEQNYQIQRLSVELSEKRVESTRMLFEGGRVGIRELLDSQDDLSAAQNSLTKALVNHRISWLRLLDQLEALPIASDTLWSSQLEIE